MNKQTRSRLKLVGIFILFVVPLAIAYGLYYGMHDVMAGDGTNEGQLLTPAQPLPTLALRRHSKQVTSAEVLRGQWTFLQVAPRGCDSACRDSLKETRQVWALLHDERSRVQRVLLVGTGHVPEFRHAPRLQIYSGDLSALWSLMKKHHAVRAGTVYLVDPHANWVLYYPPQQNGEGLFQDTKHLLDLSYIG